MRRWLLNLFARFGIYRRETTITMIGDGNTITIPTEGPTSFYRYRCINAGNMGMTVQAGQTYLVPPQQVAVIQKGRMRSLQPWPD